MKENAETLTETQIINTIVSQSIVNALEFISRFQNKMIVYFALIILINAVINSNLYVKF